MSALAVAFMAGSWAFVLGLTAWCFGRVLRAGQRRDEPPLGGPGDAAASPGVGHEQRSGERP